MPDPGKNTPLHFTHRLTLAVDYARHLHIERRKGTGIPYLAHLFGVASLVMGESGLTGFPVTEDMVIAALLHDAVEDHGGAQRLEDIRQNFGSDVARMVEGSPTLWPRTPMRKSPGSDARRTISSAFAASRTTSGSSPPPTSFTTRAPSLRTIA
jgi:(p)ppGpp synthase/HD superfamily hydrolase